MKKLIRILCLILVVSMCFVMAGCDAESRASAEYSKRIEAVNAEMADGMTSQAKKNYSFYVLKVKDHYKTIVNDCVDVYNLEDHISTDLENGQIALVKADVNLVTGGFAGYCNDIFVKNVRSIKIMDYKDVAKKVDIPVAGSDTFAYDRRFFKYEKDGDVYFVLLYCQYIEVFKNSEPYMEYEYDGLDDDFSPFFEKVGK